MNTRNLYRLLVFLLLSAGFAGLSTGEPVRGAPSPSLRLPEALAGPRALLNEVMPKPDSAAPAWVELYAYQELQHLYMPVLFNTSASSPALSGRSGAALVGFSLDLHGWQVSNEAGQVYTLPDNLTAVPIGTYVLILFDGQGPAGNDYDPADGKITLHTPAGLGDVFPDAAGQVGLYRPGERSAQTAADFVAWGALDEVAAANAIAAGIWGAGEAASFENGLGDISQADLLEKNESLGRPPGELGVGVLNWANYPSASLTPGAANPVQPVLFITPENGARVDRATLSLSWRLAAGADAYRFQFDQAPDFATPLVDEVVTDTFYKPQTPPAPGVYYWRTNPMHQGQPAGWSAAHQIEAVSFTAINSATDTERVLGIAKIRQNKDSRLLGLDGAPEGDPTTDLPEDAWDAPAPCVNPPCADYTKFMHGNMYCVRASIRMMASYYSGGGLLNMDRISYYILQEWAGNTNPGTHDSNPDNDLGYNRGMYYPDEEDEGISWALNAAITTPGGKPTFAQVKAFIDANRPIMFRRPGHMMVIDGYRELTAGGQYLHILDPDQPPDLERWQDYSTQTIDGYWPGPAGGASRTNEASVTTDSDSDGIMNFDETLRFLTNPLQADTDGDWVPDKKDMREYVFDAAGNFSPRSSDTDGDGLRKERDPDNDQDGTPEGCEDTNYNGIYQAGLGETDNFSAASHQACVPHFDLLYPLEIAPVNAGDISAPDKILVQVSTAVPNGWALALAPGDFSVSIGGSSATVIAVYPSADTYFLVVQPPGQSAAAYYDLEVSLVGASSDAEQNAVYYLPKPPNDEVIVLDRSGSMSDAGKIGAAQNAASAFVDMLNDGDLVGVTSFATTATTDYALTEITGVAERNAAIAAINGLAASGTTALGQGVQEGYDLLAAGGHADHAWSLVLLSDGWQNVPPYWADVAPGITGAVVHTVALGADADQTLLQSIAGAKHGNYFYVDVDPPGALSLESGEAATSLAPDATPPVSIAQTLPNRLADTYVAIGELTQGYQRLAETGGQALETPPITLKVNVNKGLPLAVFTLNWDSPIGYLSLALVDPSGNRVMPDAEYRGPTHHQLRVNKPMDGTWTVSIQILKPTAEYRFMLSGKTNTTLVAAAGGDPLKRTIFQPVPIFGVLTDEKPVLGAAVYAQVAGPGLPKPPGAAAPSSSLLLQLFDDGKHGDGEADDGLYANLVTGIYAPGGYTVKVVATGTNNSGEPFLRYANVGFNVLPRIAYVWSSDLSTASEVASLIGDQTVVDLVSLNQAAKTDFRPYNLVIVGHETGDLATWGTEAALGTILKSGRPVLGIGEGGYAFFGKLGLNIGYANGAHSQGTSILASNPGDSIWLAPYPVSFLTGALTLYGKPSPRVDIYLGNQPPNVLVFGINSEDRRYANLIMENSFHMLWGFDNGPRAMSALGRQLFVNAVFRALR